VEPGRRLRLRGSRSRCAGSFAYTGDTLRRGKREGRRIQQGAHSLAAQLAHYGLTTADAGPAALGIVYEQLLHQSMFLAFMDCFRVIGWLNILALPLVFAVRKFKPGGETPAGH
jgi:hypothetical protein